MIDLNMSPKGFILLVILLSSGVFNLTGQEWQLDHIPQYETFEELYPQINMDNDTTYVVNFWATWCGPCVKELPYFEELNTDYKDQAFKMILVSLDMEKQLESKLVPFLNDNKIQTSVVVLLDGKANRWIDKVDPSWSGAIPITIVHHGKQKKFHEEVFHSKEELEAIVLPFLNN